MGGGSTAREWSQRASACERVRTGVSRSRTEEYGREKPCAHFEGRSSPGCEQSSSASDTSPTKDMERNPLGMSDMVYVSRLLCPCLARLESVFVSSWLCLVAAVHRSSRPLPRV